MLLKRKTTFKLMKPAKMSHVSDSNCLMIAAIPTSTVRRTSSLLFASSWSSNFLHGFLAIYSLIRLRNSLVGFVLLYCCFFLTLYAALKWKFEIWVSRKELNLHNKIWGEKHLRYWKLKNLPWNLKFIWPIFESTSWLFIYKYKNVL